MISFFSFKSTANFRIVEVVLSAPRKNESLDNSDLVELLLSSFSDSFSDDFRKIPIKMKGAIIKTQTLKNASVYKCWSLRTEKI